MCTKIVIFPQNNEGKSTFLQKSMIYISFSSLLFSTTSTFYLTIEGTEEQT